LRIIFMGTPRFAVPSLSKLVSDGHDVMAVVTQPQRPSGRGLEPTPPPVKVLADEKGLRILQPESVNLPESIQELTALEPELIVVVAYGAILRRPLLELPSLGCVNLHASLLPRLRGVAPINWAIMEGHRATGVTTIWMNEKVDAGEIILQRYVPILPEETAGELEERLCHAGSELLSRTLLAIKDGDAPKIPQDAALSTYAPMLKKEDGVIDWSKDAEALSDHIRGVTPWPSAQTTIHGEPLKILKARVIEPMSAYYAGSILKLDEDGAIAVAAGHGVLHVIAVQPAGKKPMAAVDFARGRRLREGERFGT
jgi:methionyl-tRNA formyltransferase